MKHPNLDFVQIYHCLEQGLEFQEKNFGASRPLGIQIYSPTKVFQSVKKLVPSVPTLVAAAVTTSSSQLFFLCSSPAASLMYL